MKKMLVLLSALFLASCAHMPKSPTTLNTYTKSVVMVMVSSLQGRWSGTGFSVETHNNGDDVGSYVLTNKHVCAAGADASYTLTDYQGRRYRASFVRYAPQADLCLLQTDAIIKPVELAKSDPKKGDHIMVIGAARGDMPLITEGYVSGYTPIDIKDGEGLEIHVRALQTSVPIYPGNSGSSAFNDAGLVVGIMFAGRRDSEHITYMVGVEDILKFLDTSQDVYSRK